MAPQVIEEGRYEFRMAMADDRNRYELCACRFGFCHELTDGIELVLQLTVRGGCRRIGPDCASGLASVFHDAGETTFGRSSFFWVSRRSHRSVPGSQRSVRYCNALTALRPAAATPIDPSAQAHRRCGQRRSSSCRGEPQSYCARVDDKA